MSTRSFWAGGALGIGGLGAAHGGAVWIVTAIAAGVLLAGLTAAEIGGMTHLHRIRRRFRRT